MFQKLKSIKHKTENTRDGSDLRSAISDCFRFQKLTVFKLIEARTQLLREINMNNNYKPVWQRRFLVEGLPEPLSPRDLHWQVFDNYIENTRLRLRKIRVPETKNWTRVFEQRIFFEDDNFSELKLSQMYLTESEYNKLEYFKGREIRKNRYFLQYNDRQIAIDIFLGELWGLNIGLVEFENEEDCSMFEKPEFSVSEVTNNKFFTGETLVGKTFADVQKEFTRKSKKAK